jgi:hypothetical protein
MAIRSKRKEIEEQKVYCRKCMASKKSTDFFVATDEYLDSNGRMSVCSACCNLIYNNIYSAEKNISKSLLRCCRMLNVRFDEDAVEATKAHLNTLAQSGKETSNVFGIYKGKILSSAKKNFSDKNSTLDLTFYEPVGLVFNSDDPVENHEDEKTAEELNKFWGEGKSYEEIVYLQNEFNELGGATTKDDRPKAILLREICFQMLDIEKNRNSPGIDKKVKVLAELMGNSAIRPDQKKVADGNKSSEAFGVWLADIEKYKPAEWYKNQNIYKDVNGIKEYWDTHILRPFLNFWGVQKNMNFPGAVERDDSFNDSPSDISED